MKKRILFFGTPDIAVPCLEKLCGMQMLEIVGVGVSPDKKVGRKQILTPSPVKKKAQERGLPIFEVATSKDLVSLFENQKCDLALVIAFGMIFPEKVLSMPSQGVVNIHFSLLPRYRGASPVQSAILNADPVSGITFQQMVYALDRGDILYQKSYPIVGLKTSEVFKFFGKESAEMLPDFLSKFFIQSMVPRPQEESQATVCKKLDKKDGEIFPFRQTADEIYRRYLAFDLFPGIFMSSPKGPLKLLEINREGGGVPLKCAQDTSLKVAIAQLPGKKPAPMADILRGNPPLRDYFL